LRTGMVVSGVVLAILGAALVVLLYLTDTISQILSPLLVLAVAGALILVGTMLLVVGLVKGSGSGTLTLPSPQIASGAICPKCGGGLPLVAGKIRCPYCGRKVIPLMTRSAQQPQYQVQWPSQQMPPTQAPPKFCNFCGSPLHPLASFCQQCGRPIKS
jgi:hypothetical protein